MHRKLLDKIRLLIYASLCVSALILTVLLVITFVVFPYQYEHGLNWKGIDHKYYTAIQEGNGKDAIFWAKKGYAYDILGKGGQIHDSEYRIAQAYELDGQVEKAALWYKIAEKR